MKLNSSIRIHQRRLRAGERGYVLLVLLLFIALMAIALVAEVPAIKTQIKRDHEEEMIHRGTQYTRAIKRFYKKFGRYPTRLDELESTNNMRFLRQRYKDPMSADGKWKLIHYGEQKVTPTGFFGAPAGTTQLGATLGGQSGPGTSSGPTFAGPSFGPTGQATSQPGTQNPQQPGTPAAQMGTLQPGGATFGGGPIIGVASTSEESSLKELNGKSHYNDWEFVYDPRLDLSNQAVTPMVSGQPGQLQPGQVQPGVQQQQPATPIMPGMPVKQ